MRFPFLSLSSRALLVGCTIPYLKRFLRNYGEHRRKIYIIVKVEEKWN
jgi:hypothetical protein